MLRHLFGIAAAPGWFTVHKRRVDIVSRNLNDGFLEARQMNGFAEVAG